MAEYYRLKKDYKECLKYLLKTTDQYRDWYYIQTATCNWLIGNKDTALKIYNDLLDENLTSPLKHTEIIDSSTKVELLTTSRTLSIPY